MSRFILVGGDIKGSDEGVVYLGMGFFLLRGLQDLKERKKVTKKERK